MSYSIYDRFEDEEPFDNENDRCADCIHRISKNSPESGCIKGCELWECNYETKPPMTIEDAIEIYCKRMEVDYKGLSEDEVEEIDEALDLILDKVKAYIKRDTAEWKDYIDGATGRKTDKGICGKCGVVNSWKTPYCPWCGRQMRNVRKREPEPDLSKALPHCDTSKDALFDEAVEDLRKGGETP